MSSSLHFGKKLGGGLALGLGGLLATSLDAGKNVLTVLVELEASDDDVAGVDAEGNRLAGGLVAGDALNVDDVLEAVNRGDLALLVLVEATDDPDLVVLADGDAPDLGVCQSDGRGTLNRRRQHTLYFSRSSLLRGALMMSRRTLEGALKWALRDLRLEDETSVHIAVNFLIEYNSQNNRRYLLALTLAIVIDTCRRRTRSQGG